MLTMMTFERAQELLRSAPGPAPWYLRQAEVVVDSRFGPLSWGKFEGASPLLDPAGRTRLLLGPYSYSRRLDATRVLVWFAQRRHRNVPRLEAGGVDFFVIDVNQLQSITDPAQMTRIMRENDLPLVMFTDTPEPRVPVLSLPIGLEDGKVAIGIPEEMSNLEELFFFVWSGTYRLWALQPSLGMMSVTTQDWYDVKTADVGYQWPTRAARDPESRRIVGDGIRIGTFLLDEAGRQVERWLAPRK